MATITFGGIWLLVPALPYAFGLTSCLIGLGSTKAERRAGNLSLSKADRQVAEMHRYSSKQNAIAFGVLAILTSVLFLFVEAVFRHFADG